LAVAKNKQNNLKTIENCKLLKTKNPYRQPTNKAFENIKQMRVKAFSNEALKQ